jgi:hypothetical protein
MEHQCYIFIDSEVMEKVFQIVDTAFEAVIVSMDIRLVRQTAPDMIRDNGPKPFGQAFDQFPVIERPRGIPVNHDNRVTVSFIEEMIIQTVDVHVMGFKRVKVTKL